MHEQCIDPHVIQEGDLVAYIEGVASQEVVAHIALCTACAHEVEALRETEAILEAVLFRASCPSVEDLLAYQTSLLPQPAHFAVQAHLKTCAACRDELAILGARSMQETLSEASQEASDKVSRPRLAHIFEMGQQLIQAILVSVTTEPALAVRGSERRQQVYQAAEYQVTLGIIPPLVTEDIWQIEGQILWQNSLPPIDQETMVALTQDGVTTLEDQVDDLGYFFLEGIGPGHYTLEVRLPTTQIHIEEIELR